MAIDSGLLYADMIVSFLLHLSGTIAIATLFSGVLSDYSVSTRVWILIVATMVFSFMVNMGVLLFLQTTSCGGLKDIAGVAKGAFIGSALTGFFMWIPSIWEGLRLSISQVFVDHKSLMTPLEAAQDRILVPASQQILGIPAATAVPVKFRMDGDVAVENTNITPLATQVGGKRLTPEEYADQTFSEIKSALAYMSAFAGAYGVGIGSRYAVNCKTAA